ncbi:MAG: hypothetical protein Q8L27_00235 [archaeon]|nr:hypothetical protein [archaeon]
MATRKINKRCNDECYSYKYGANNEPYCIHGPKLRKVNSNQRCVYSLEKLQNPEYDDQGFPMSIPTDKLAELAQSPTKCTEPKNCFSKDVRISS